MSVVGCVNADLSINPTGVAFITLEDGDNGIFIIKGANEQVDADYVDCVASKLLESDLYCCKTRSRLIQMNTS